VVGPELGAEVEAVVDIGSSETRAFGVSAAEVFSPSTSSSAEGRRGSDFEKDLGRS
jgi:hypothetical protein